MIKNEINNNPGFKKRLPACRSEEDDVYCSPQLVVSLHYLLQQGGLSQDSHPTLRYPGAQ